MERIICEKGNIDEQELFLPILTTDKLIYV
jgi:hypothetical protein